MGNNCCGAPASPSSKKYSGSPARKNQQQLLNAADKSDDSDSPTSLKASQLEFSPEDKMEIEGICESLVVDGPLSLAIPLAAKMLVYNGTPFDIQDITEEEAASGDRDVLRKKNENSRLRTELLSLKTVTVSQINPPPGVARVEIRESLPLIVSSTISKAVRECDNEGILDSIMNTCFSPRELKQAEIDAKGNRSHSSNQILRIIEKAVTRACEREVHCTIIGNLLLGLQDEIVAFARDEQDVAREKEFYVFDQENFSLIDDKDDGGGDIFWSEGKNLFYYKDTNMIFVVENEAWWDCAQQNWFVAGAVSSPTTAVSAAEGEGEEQQQALLGQQEQEITKKTSSSTEPFQEQQQSGDIGLPPLHPATSPRKRSKSVSFGKEIHHYPGDEKNKHQPQTQQQQPQVQNQPQQQQNSKQQQEQQQQQHQQAVYKIPDHHPEHEVTPTTQQLQNNNNNQQQQLQPQEQQTVNNNNSNNTQENSNMIISPTSAAAVGAASTNSSDYAELDDTFIFDDASSLFWSSHHQLFFDPVARVFGNTEKWFE